MKQKVGAACDLPWGDIEKDIGLEDTKVKEHKEPSALEHGSKTRENSKHPEYSLEPGTSSCKVHGRLVGQWVSGSVDPVVGQCPPGRCDQVLTRAAPWCDLIWKEVGLCRCDRAVTF